MPPSAQAGSCCTPEQQAPTGRPKTPDTAKLLQRALASSSGTALLNSLSHGASKSHPGRLKPAGDAKPHPGGAGAVAASSESAQQSAAGPAAVPDPRVALVSSCMSTAAATDMGSAVLATAQARGSKDGCGVVLGATINQEALSQQQAQEPGSSNQSGAPQPAGTDQQHQVAPPSASVGQQQGGRQPAKQERQPWTGLLSDGQVNLDPQAGACQQISVELNPAEDYRHAGALQQREVGPVGVGSGASIADSARHVTPQVQLLLAGKPANGAHMLGRSACHKAEHERVPGMSCS